MAAGGWRNIQTRSQDKRRYIVDDRAGHSVATHLVACEWAADHVAGEPIFTLGVGGFGANAVVHRGDLSRLFRVVPGVASTDFYHYFHSDPETPDTVPWTGLEATTRAYTRLIDEVNKHDLSVFQRPEEPVP